MVKKALSFYTKYFAIWVIVFGIMAYFVPKPFLALRDYMEWFFALTMFGIGATLHFEDFKRITRKPMLLLIGSASQYSIMPIGAFLIAKLFNLPPELAVGLILTGSAPGAMASNVMSYIAKADVPYSVNLTTLSTLLCPILTPAITYFLTKSILEVSFWVMFFSLLKMIVIPVYAGVLIRKIFKEKIERIIEIFPAISVTFIIFICSLVIALNKAYLTQVTIIVVVAVLVLNIYGMLMGYGVGAMFRMENKRRRTLSIEIGMQNAGLGTVLALKHFGEQSAIPAAIFVFICIITASTMAELWQREIKDEAV